MTHQHDGRLQRVPGPVAGRVVPGGAEDRAAARRVQLAPDVLPRRTPARELAAEQRRVGGHRDHGRPERMRQAHAVGPAVLRPGVEVDLNRRGRGHHRRACGAGLAGGEERLHRLVAVAGIDTFGGAQRIGPEQHQPQTRLREGRAQHSAVGCHRGDGRHRTIHRRARQLDGSAGFDGHRAAAGQCRNACDGFRQFIPAGPPHRVGQIEAVRLDLQAHPAHRTVAQAVVADIEGGTVCAGQFGRCGIDKVRFVHLGRDGEGHVSHPFRVGNDRRRVPSSRAHRQSRVIFRVTCR